MNGSGSSSIKAGDIVKCIATPYLNNSIVVTGYMPEKGGLYYVERICYIKEAGSNLITEGIILVGTQLKERYSGAEHGFHLANFEKVERYCLTKPASNYKRGVHDAAPITVEPLPQDMMKEALQLANLY